MSPSSQEWQVAEISRTGLLRNENQDRMCGSHARLGRFHVIADGMGGHKGGAMAAQLTVDGLRRHLDQAPPTAPVASVLREAFDRTNHDVYRIAHSGDPDHHGIGSTAVVLLISGPAVHVAHVGDSRAYLFRKGRLRRLTKDHTRAQQMVDAEILTPEQALDHPSASVLERAVGTRPVVDVDFAHIHPKRKDVFLLCSDGLSGYVEDAAIEEVLKRPLPAADIPTRLVDLALLRGSKDDITVQYLQYGQFTRVGSARVFRWLLVAAVAGALLAGLMYLVRSHAGLSRQTPEALVVAHQPSPRAPAAQDDGGRNGRIRVPRVGSTR